MPLIGPDHFAGLQLPHPQLCIRRRGDHVLGVVGERTVPHPLAVGYAVALQLERTPVHLESCHVPNHFVVCDAPETSRLIG